MSSGFPNPESAFMPRSSDYSRRPFPPGFDAAYSQPMGPPSRSPIMPLQPLYPPPWQAPTAGSPYAQGTAPYAGHMPYPPQPAPPQSPAYSTQPAAEPSPVEESAEQAPIEEIRASLREFREAVRELTESRARRRYF